MGSEQPEKIKVVPMSIEPSRRRDGKTGFIM
jgi:hypothetical protein